MSDTPKTDQDAKTLASSRYDGLCHADFARELERENVLLRSALSAYVNADEWTKALDDQAVNALVGNSRSVAKRPRICAENHRPD